MAGLSIIIYYFQLHFISLYIYTNLNYRLIKTNELLELKSLTKDKTLTKLKTLTKIKRNEITCVYFVYILIMFVS